MEKQGLFTDNMFDGWVSSHTFFACAEHKGNPSVRDLSLAISVIQFPPLREHAGGALAPLQNTMAPTVQTLEIHQGKKQTLLCPSAPGPEFCQAMSHMATGSAGAKGGSPGAKGGTAGRVNTSDAADEGDGV